MFFCCMLSGRGLCDELITRPEESYRPGASLCVIKKPCERGGHSPRWAAEPEKNKIVTEYINIKIIYHLLTYSMEQSPSMSANKFHTHSVQQDQITIRVKNIISDKNG
jgi:hypothetical protein